VPGERSDKWDTFGIMTRPARYLREIHGATRVAVVLHTSHSKEISIDCEYLQCTIPIPRFFIYQSFIFLFIFVVDILPIWFILFILRAYAFTFAVYLAIV
jgi:hypothetical protein